MIMSSAEIDYPKIAADVAQALLGKPNADLSSPGELRFGTHGSLSVDLRRAVWHDHENGTGGGLLDLIIYKTGGSTSTAKQWLRERGFIPAEHQAKDRSRIVAEYPYTDEAGKLLFQVVRLEPKSFRQRAPDGNGGWQWSIRGVRRVLYRLPEIMNAPDGALVYLVEGEKDADRIASLGLIATTCPGGAGKWQNEYGSALAGRRIVIVPDNDDAGRDHAATVFNALRAADIECAVLVLEDLPQKGDVSDWLAAGGDIGTLNGLAKAALLDTSAAEVSDLFGEDIQGTPDLSHNALALGLGSSHWDRNARYVALSGKWLFWSGSHWQVDEKLSHMTMARNYLDQRAADLLAWAKRQGETESESTAAKIITRAKDEARNVRSGHTVAAVIGLARSNAASAACIGDFDADRMLLGTPGGTVDLRTGILRTAQRDDMITKQTAVAPASVGTHPQRWLAFLSEIFGQDQETIKFMQRAAGYALTGMTSEHKLLFLYGTGRNGKSVFMNTLVNLYGSYARRAPSAAFLNSQAEGHPTDLAGLHGARLVVGSELPKGKSWNEAVIKDLTGGDRITARFMRQDYFDFDPQLTLMIAGNNQPSFSGVDEAIRARVVLVPFSVTIPSDKRDPALAEKLQAEAPAILRWAIDGALEWQRRGLSVPASILAASEEYLDHEDLLGQFLADETCRAPEAFTLSSDLHQRFRQWCMTQELTPWSVHIFVKELRARGFQYNRRSHGRGFLELQLQ